jgi:L-asparaginase
MQSNSRIVVVLGTGGTIAGAAAHAADNLGYVAGALALDSLVEAVPALGQWRLELEQVAQVDSKDMDHALWRRLAISLQSHLEREDVSGVVITHGTDTMEETAWFLHRVLGPTKPVVLTGAMRPATSALADGPHNLTDAVMLASNAGVCGVLVLMEGRVHSALDVRKSYGYRVDAFTSGERGPLALVREAELIVLRPWPSGAALGLEAVKLPVEDWPRVDIVVSHAGCDGALVRAAEALGCRGLVVEGTGNGTVHQAMALALSEAQSRGVSVCRATRCQSAGVVGESAGLLPSAGELTPAKARVELLLTLLTKGERGAGALRPPSS